MTGKAYSAIFKYYDGQSHKMAFKKRPILIIGQADKNDYVVLPISRVSRKEFLDPRYDFKMEVAEYPLLHLKDTSYIRTHKQTVINVVELADCIVDFKKEYLDAYISVIALVEEFQQNLINDAL